MKYAKGRVDKWDDRDKNVVEVAVALKKREEEGFTLASDEIEFLHYVMTMVVEAKEHFGIDD